MSKLKLSVERSCNHCGRCAPAVEFRFKRNGIRQSACCECERRIAREKYHALHPPRQRQLLPEDRPCTKCGRALPEVSFRYYKGRRESACRVCSRVLSLERYHKLGETRYDLKHKAAHYKRTYGISLAEVENIWLTQNGQCGICQKQVPNPARVHVYCQTHLDHCHTSKMVRGILCDRCNKALGGFNDNLYLLQAAIDYLRSY